MYLNFTTYFPLSVTLLWITALSTAAAAGSDNAEEVATEMKEMSQHMHTLLKQMQSLQTKVSQKGLGPNGLPTSE
jgi:hypothetical protein